MDGVGSKKMRRGDRHASNPARHLPVIGSDKHDGDVAEVGQMPRWGVDNPSGNMADYPAATCRHASEILHMKGANFDRNPNLRVSSGTRGDAAAPSKTAQSCENEENGFHAESHAGQCMILPQAGLAFPRYGFAGCSVVWTQCPHSSP